MILSDFEYKCQISIYILFFRNTIMVLVFVEFKRTEKSDEI